MSEGICFVNRYLIFIIALGFPLTFFVGAASEDLLDFLPWRNRHRRRRNKKK